MLIESAIVALAGGIICLDRVLLQVMISRPVVAGPLTGFILGDPYTGLIIGAFIELLWIDRSPIGVYIPPNDSAVAIIVTGCSVLVGRELGHLSRELVALSILVFIPCGILGQKIDIRIARSNDTLSQRAMEDAKRGNLSGISRKHISLICGVQILLLIFPLIPENILKAFSYIYFFLPVIGIAVALNTIKLRGIIPVFSGIFLIGALLIEVL